MTQDLDAAAWRTSTSTGQGENCVVIGRLWDLAGIRDSKLGKESPTLVFPAASLDALLSRLALT